MEEFYNFLLNYGVLGIWTISLIVEKFKFQNKTEKVIENNTQALNRFLDYHNYKRTTKV